MSLKAIAAAVMLCVLAGCTAGGAGLGGGVGVGFGGAGGLQLNSGAEKAFTSGTLKPDLVYYTYGSSASPDVVIGVDKAFILENTDSWYPIAPRENLGGIVRLMYDRYRMDRPDVPLRGFRMIDQQGRYVGDWYSAWNASTSIRSEENRVYISPPTLPSSGFGHGIRMRR